MSARRYFLKVLGLGVLAAAAPPQQLALATSDRRIFYLEDYGLNGDALINGNWNANLTDNAPLWNAIIAKAQPFDEYVCPPGFMGFRSKPLMFPSYCRLSGRGAFTGLVKCYTPENPTEFFFEVGPEYVTLDRLILYQGAGQSLGRAFGRVATGPDSGLYGLVARDITISSLAGAEWRDAVVLDATRATKLYGGRALCIDHLFVGAVVEDMALCLSGIEGGGNIDKFQAAAGKLVLSGVKGINRSNLLHISGNCNAAITMNNTLVSKLDISSFASLTIDDTCLDVTVHAAFFDAVPVVKGVNNYVRAGKYEWKSPSKAGPKVVRRKRLRSAEAADLSHLL